MIEEPTGICPGFDPKILSNFIKAIFLLAAFPAISSVSHPKVVSVPNDELADDSRIYVSKVPLYPLVPFWKTIVGVDVAVINSI